MFSHVAYLIANNWLTLERCTRVKQTPPRFHTKHYPFSYKERIVKSTTETLDIFKLKSSVCQLKFSNSADMYYPVLRQLPSPFSLTFPSWVPFIIYKCFDGNIYVYSCLSIICESLYYKLYRCRGKSTPEVFKTMV